ncbi:MAG: amidophosphoribosyltransferase [Candidatus Lokiarchaeota archaeon]|nr:amidophosphoribosyltransferase [Candidatus Lokiarchaeota archaeon]MBD3341396.1 amidophosphoribosyltransferase [Candidatus Lokiarchaeota archaeon]
MRDKPIEHCAVFGVTCDDIGFSVSKLLYQGLIALQHRGQESTGISIMKTGGAIHTYKRKGLVSKVLNRKTLTKFWGNVGIGHNRYATTGSSNYSSSDFLQPFHFNNNELEFSFAFNGTIPNYDDVKEKMDNMGRVFVTNTDTEVMAQLFASIAMGTENWPEILKIASRFLDGSYSLVIMTNRGDLYAMRDPLGFKPLCIGQLKTSNRNLYFVASESCAIDAVGGILLRDVKPGEIVHLSHQKDIHSEMILKNDKTALCQFEFVYFARPDSIIDDVSVAEARLRLGENLASNDSILNDPDFRKNAIVVPVPDSGRSAAVGYAKKAGLPYVEGLMKNRYVWRTFIMPGQKERKAAVKEKLNPIKSVIQGKDIILVDDSIVRGTTTKQIVSLLRESGGAKSVHLRISCPPVIRPCYMGIDFPTTNELIAGRFKEKFGKKYIEEIRERIGADTLLYQTIENLKEAVGKNEKELCLACLTGKYPLRSVQEKLHNSKEIIKRNDF